MPRVFQYGSNCSTERLNSPEKLDGAAVVQGSAQTVDKYEIAFDVWSGRNRCAAADIISVRETGRHAWGVLYQTSDKGLERLRKVEGPMYEEKPIRDRILDGEIVDAATFIVRAAERRRGLWTSANYVGYIVRGLRDRGVPEEYVQHVLDVAIHTDEIAEDRDKAESQLPSLEALRAR